MSFCLQAKCEKKTVWMLTAFQDCEIFHVKYYNFIDWKIYDQKLCIIFTFLSFMFSFEKRS